MSRAVKLLSVAAFFAAASVSGQALAAEEGIAARSTAAAAQQQNSVSHYIRRYLGAVASQRFDLPDDVRKDVGAFYAVRDFEPVWTGANGLKERARQTLERMSRAEEDGLTPSDYLPASLNGYDDDAAMLAGNAAVLAKLELELTRAALRFARHASAGRLIPSAVDRNMAISPKPVAAMEVLEGLTGAGTPDAFLDGLFPAMQEYGMMRSELARYRKLNRRLTSEPIADGGLIRPGDTDPRIVDVRRRLIELGSYAITVSEETHTASAAAVSSEAILASEDYDSSLVKAVKAFQRARGLSVDGIIGRGTVTALNSNYESQIKRIMANMERMRWLPADLGRKHILVNQASFEMRLVEDETLVHKARVIVGKPRHQTPVFSDVMEFIVMNPYWNVPRSIATKEMLPVAARDPYYFARKGYEVFYGGKRINSTDIYWDEVPASGFPFHVRQPPGRSNALGKLKFMFPNRHNIYLHDTPSKSLFQRTSRAFSHGCVRLQNPQRLAELLLGADRGWSKKRINRMIATGKNQRINLKQKIPVHLTYFTVWPDENGQLTFKRDFYGRDQAVIDGLGEIRLALN